MSEEIEDFTLTLDPEVDEALSSVFVGIVLFTVQILKSEDPLDAPDFDPVVYINAQVSIVIPADLIFVVS